MTAQQTAKTPYDDEIESWSGLPLGSGTAPGIQLAANKLRREGYLRAVADYADLLAAAEAALLWIQQPSSTDEILPTLRAAIARGAA